MDQSGVVITPDVSKIIAERAELWQQFDDAHEHFSKMDFSEVDQLATEVAAAIPAEMSSKLSKEGTPATEVAAAFHKFQEELAHMAERRDEIAAYRAEIKKVESQRRLIVILAGLTIMFVLCRLVS